MKYVEASDDPWGTSALFLWRPEGCPSTETSIFRSESIKMIRPIFLIFIEKDRLLNDNQNLVISGKIETVI